MSGLGFSASRLFGPGLPESDVKRSLAFAAAFNLFGMPIQLVILRGSPTVPRWPLYMSMSFAALLLVLLYWRVLDRKIRAMKVLFVANAAFVTLALTYIYSHFDGRMIPFQATKLGAIVAAMLAPGFFVGLLAIAVHVGTGVIQYLLFSPETRALIHSGEPYAMLAFGLGGCFILAHRLRMRYLETQMARAMADVAANRRLAQAFLEIRDQMNTPLQAIEIAAVLMKDKRFEEDRHEVLERLNVSCERLRDISRSLRKYEELVDWKADRGGLGT